MLREEEKGFWGIKKDEEKKTSKYKSASLRSSSYSNCLVATLHCHFKETGVYLKRVRVYLMYRAPPKRFTYCTVICYFKSLRPHFPVRIEDTGSFQAHAIAKCVADV